MAAILPHLGGPGICVRPSVRPCVTAVRSAVSSEQPAAPGAAPLARGEWRSCTVDLGSLVFWECVCLRPWPGGAAGCGLFLTQSLSGVGVRVVDPAP